MILKGDCIEVMKAMKPNSVDAIVTDPPYGLEFMGKEWDQLKSKGHWDGNRGWQGDTKDAYGRYQGIAPSKYQAGLEMQLWHAQWLTEAYRVLKPGASMLVMGGTRTSHRLACAIEDSGFIIKDTLMWLYGSGFPKAQEVSVLVDAKILGLSTKEVKERRKVVGERIRLGDKKSYPNNNQEAIFNPGENNNITQPLTPEGEYWDGFKVGGIKPAYEPIIWAVKPPEGSYVDNVLKWGVGAVNVEATRVSYQNNNDKEIAHINALGPIERYKTHKQIYGGGRKSAGFKDTHSPKGRFPANVILSHHPECVQVGMKKVKKEGGGCRLKTDCGKSFYKVNVNKNSQPWVDKDGYEQVESWDCHPDCAVRLLDEQSGNLPNNYRKNKGIGKNNCAYFGNAKSERDGIPYNDNGGASRFFYCAKASRGERNAGLEGMEEKPIQINEPHNSKTLDERYGMKAKNNHPTVKPIKLFEWLIKLVTREGQIILDPFIGSGTTAIAAHNIDRKCMGIEKEEEYLEIAKRRATHWRSQPRQLEIRI